MKVVFVLCNKMLATSMTLPTELLLAAHSLANSKQSASTCPKALEIITASEDGKQVKTHTGLTITPDECAADIQSADILYLPAIWRNPLPLLKNTPHTQTLIARCHTMGGIIAGVGTGCCFIAQTGLLDDKPATTHWYYFDTFAKNYPNVALKRQVFITQADNIFCAASVNALAELTTSFIQKSYSSEIASYVQRHFFHEIRQNLKHENLYMDISAGHTDEDVIRVQTWLGENYASPINMNDTAQQFGISVRTLNRKFKQVTGATPLQYLHSIRADAARDLINNTNLSLSEIMERVGYYDTSHFNKIFAKQFGVTPSHYRTTIRGKIFNT